MAWRWRTAAAVIGRLRRGPEPRPAWVVTSQAAVDTELGILKTGKEADVFLLERADPHAPGSGVVMAAKRYRAPEHRSFHRSASYTEGRSMKRSRKRRSESTQPGIWLQPHVDWGSSSETSNVKTRGRPKKGGLLPRRGLPLC